MISSRILKPIDVYEGNEILPTIKTDNFQDTEFDEKVASFVVSSTDNDSGSDWSFDPLIISSPSPHTSMDTNSSTSLPVTVAAASTFPSSSSLSSVSSLSVPSNISHHSKKSRKRRCIDTDSSDQQNQTTLASSSSSSSSASTTATIQYHLPRIWRKDIRRQYATMFANVYNSCDYEFMKKYLEIFYRPDLTLVLSKVEGMNFLERQECTGAENCSAVWFERMNDAPDLHFQLERTQIKVRSDDTAVVSSTFEISGTKILQLSPEDMRRFKLIPSFDDNNENNNENPHPLPTAQGTIEHKDLPSSSLLTEDDPLLFDRDIAEALSDILNDEQQHTMISDPISSTVIEDSFTIMNPTSKEKLAQEAEEALNLELICKFEEAMSLNRHQPPPPPNAVTVPFKFSVKGTVSLHLDSDSKVYLIDFRILKS